MKVRYIKSACVVIEHAGKRVLCDPWLTDGIYFGSWYHYPPLQFHPEDFSDVDYIYISHIHPDHMDVETLKRLPRSIKLLILEYEEKYLLRILQQLGFRDILEVPHRGVRSLGPDFTVELLAADDCDPDLFGRYFSCTAPTPYPRTLQIDSLAVFCGGGKTVVNTNDCRYPLAYKVCDYIRDKHHSIDLLLVSHSGAGEYPQCFDNLDDSAKLDKAEVKKKQFLDQAIQYLKHLSPRYFIPFAGEYTLGGRAAPLNRFRGVLAEEEIAAAFAPLIRREKSMSECVLLNSGEWFDLEGGVSSTPFVPPDPRARQRYIEEVLAKKKFLYEDRFRIEKSDWVDLAPRLEEAQARLWRRQEQYHYRPDWRIYVETGQDYLYCIPFDGGRVQKVTKGSEQRPFLRIRVDYSLLHMILTRQAHWDNVIPTSHLRFFREPDVYERGIFHFLSYLHC